MDERDRDDETNEAGGDLQPDRGPRDFPAATLPPERGLGADSGGQSGDTEGLSRDARSSAESVEELIEEGNALEAGILSGIENAPDADQGEIRTREVPEDDVPQEYLDQDKRD